MSSGETIGAESVSRLLGELKRQQLGQEGMGRILREAVGELLRRGPKVPADTIENLLATLPLNLGEGGALGIGCADLDRALPRVLSELGQAWEALVGRPLELRGRWIRGVTSLVSDGGNPEADELEGERRALIERYLGSLADLRERASELELLPSEELRACLEQRAGVSSSGHADFLAQMQAGVEAVLNGGERAYRSPADFLADLGTLDDSLGKSADSLREVLRPLRLRVECFGFHAMGLEVAIEGNRALQAAGELLGRPELHRWDSPRRTHFLEHARLADGGRFPVETHQLLQSFRVLAKALGASGQSSLGRVVVDGVRGASELLAPVFLARALGFSDRRGAIPMDLVPRLGCADSLEEFAVGVEEALDNPVLKRHLSQRRTPLRVVLAAAEPLRPGTLAERWFERRARLRLAPLDVVLERPALDSAAISGPAGIAAALARALVPCPAPRVEAPELELGLKAAVAASTAACEQLCRSALFREFEVETARLDARLGRGIWVAEDLARIWRRGRLFLPLWYGVGTGLATLIDDLGETRAQKGAQEEGFLRAFLVEMEERLSIVDLRIAADYARLGGPSGVLLLGAFSAEWLRLRDALGRLRGELGPGRRLAVEPKPQIEVASALNRIHLGLLADRPAAERCAEELQQLLEVEGALDRAMAPDPAQWMSAR